MSVSIHIHGPEARKVAERFTQFFQDELKTTPSVSSLPAPAPNGKTKDFVGVASLLVASTALVLTIPSSVLAISDLVERMGRKKPVDDLLTLARVLFKENPDCVMTLKTDQGTLTLSRAKTSEILDLLEKPGK